MADLEKTVAVLFKGVDEMSGTLNSISGNVSSFGGKMESATQPLANIAAAVEKLDAALVLLAGGALVAATTTAGSFQNKVNEINTLISASPAEFEGFQQAILDYSRGSVKSIEEINGSIYSAISAGVSWEKSISFVTAAEQLSVAGRADLDSTTKVLIGTMNAYGATTDEASKYADDFFETIRLGQTTLPELNQSIAQVTAISGPAGVSFKEVAAAMAALTVAGIPTAQAATFLKGSISEMVKPSKEAATEAENLGIQFGAAHLKTVGLSTALKECWDATDGDTAAMAKLFGNVRGLEGALVLGKDATGKYAEALTAMANDSGAAATAYGKTADSFENVNQRIVNNLKATLIDVGTPLLKDWAKVATGIEDVFSAVDIGLKAGAFNSIYSELESFSNQAEEYLKAVAKALPEAMQNVDFSKFIQSLKDLGGSINDLFEGLFGKVDLTTPEGLADALQKVINGVNALIQVSKGIAEGLTPFAEKLGEMASGALNADGSTTELAGKILGFGQGVNTAISALNNMGPALNILSGALVLDAISSIGSLGAALVAAPWVAAAAGLAGIAYAFSKLNDPVDLATARFDEFGNLMGQAEEWSPKVAACIGDIGHQMNDLPEVKTFTIDAETGPATENIESLNTSILSFPTDFKIDIAANVDTVSFGTASSLMNDIPKEYTADFFISADQESVKETKAEIQKITNVDGTTMYINVGVDAASLTKTQDTLKEIPTEKMLEIKLQGNIDKDLAMIKTSADTVQKAMEWTAKMDIANVESATAQVEAMFSSIDNTISATSSAISDLFKNKPKYSSSEGASEWEAAIRQEMKIQEEAFKLQQQLVESQIKVLDTKNYLMKSGKGLIQIDSTGLEPALETIMWQILQKVQVKANEDSVSFLLGIN